MEDLKSAQPVNGASNNRKPISRKPDGRKPDGRKPDGRKPDGRKPKSVAITGLGVFSAAGADVASFTRSLLSGVSAIGPVDLFAPFASGIGAQQRSCPMPGFW